MRSELIMTTYNSPIALGLCLESVLLQTLMPDSICIADDGSGPETASLIDEFRARFDPVPIRHVWHEDTGFEKCKILNTAIGSSEADLLFVIDGDVLIHPNFLARHHALSRRGRFSTGSLIRLDDATTKALSKADIIEGRVFNRDWLRAHGAIDRLGTWLKTMPFPFVLQNLLDILTPVSKSLCGANWSAFRSDILAVNGFDADMKYGGEDKELGVRLKNNGVKGRHLRYTAPLCHQEHGRDYVFDTVLQQNKALIKQRRASGETWVSSGIKK